MSQQPWCSPKFYQCPRQGLKWPFAELASSGGAPNFPPCAQVEETQAEFRKSTLTAAPPSPCSALRGVPGLLMGATRGIPRTILWRLCRVHDIPSLYFPVYSEHV